MVLQDIQAVQAHIDGLRRDIAHSRAARAARRVVRSEAGDAGSPAAGTRAFWQVRRLIGARS